MVGMNCTGCGKPFRKKSKSGYCAVCFHANVNNVKTEYGKDRWTSGVSKEIHWRLRGAKITVEDINKYNESTVCGICNKSFNNDKVLDHCHSTGKYRGALCRQCNAALGKLGDDIDLVIERLESYRRSSEEESILGPREPKEA